MKLDAAMEANDGPFLVHCATGARVALLLSLSKAGQNGCNPQQSFDHARGMGFRPDDLARIFELCDASRFWFCCAFGCCIARCTMCAKLKAPRFG